MLTKLVVRKVERVSVRRSYLQVAKMHMTRMEVYYEGMRRPMEVLLFSGEPVEIAMEPNGNGAGRATVTEDEVVQTAAAGH